MNSACSTSSSGGGGGSSSLVGRGLLSTACPQGPLASQGGSGGQGKVPHQIREFLKSLDDQGCSEKIFFSQLPLPPPLFFISEATL